MSPVPYLPPTTRSAAHEGESLLQEAVSEGPPYARGRLDGRWHLVRSAYDVLREWSDSIDRIVTYWCGRSTSRGVMTADAVPDSEPTCGTCYGRREGWLRNHGLLFTPYDQVPPKVCPASGWLDLAVSIEGNYYRCLACGATVRGWWFGGAYGGRSGLTRHSPGPDLVEPCQFHAWRDLVLATGPDDTPVVACRCRTRRMPA